MNTPLQLAVSLLEAGSYDYASTDIKLPPEMADFLIDWGRVNVPEDALFEDEDGGKGQEREPHCTVKSGLLSREVPEALREIAKDTRPFPVYIGNVSLFSTNPKYDVVKLDVESPALRELNRRVSAAVPHEDTHPQYNPHVTIAYVIKGTCDQLVGSDLFASGETGRSFMASGMGYSGPGDDEDENRVKETLLFSRAKPEVTEAVLAPAPEDIDAVMAAVHSAATECHGNAALFPEVANPALEQYGVRFVPAHLTHGADGYTDDSGIVLRAPSAADLRSPEWLGRMRTVIHHEGVHAMQLDQSADPEAMNASATRYVMPGGRLDHDRYLQQKQEIMAHAASMVEAWRQQGLTSEQMMRRLRSGNWNHGMKYWYARRQYPEAFNRFVKQATEYIEQLNESTFAEVAANLDPFANCGFPADAGRIRTFLQQHSRRSPPARTLL